MSAGPRSERVRRDWGSDDSGCGVLHVDMDAFFASVEVAANPALRGKPVIVGMAERAVVLAATYEARRFGVHSAMPMSVARRLCPQAIVVPPRLTEYRRISASVMAQIHEVTAIVEQVSVDEAYLDVSGALRRAGSPVAIGQHIRQVVFEQQGVTCSVGIGPSKLIAKLASTHSKPDGLMLVPREAVVDFVQALPVGALPGVGTRTREALERRGINEVADLARTDVETLRHWLGVHGPHLHDLAWARDPRPVIPGREESSVGAERTFDEDIRDQSHIDTMLATLSDRVAGSLRAKGVVGRTVVVKVRTADFATTSRSRTLTSATDSGREILRVARSLYSVVPRRGLAVRLVGVRMEGLESRASASMQVTLDEAVADTVGVNHRVDVMMDSVRQRFGLGAINPGSTISTGTSTTG